MHNSLTKVGSLQINEQHCARQVKQLPLIIQTRAPVCEEPKLLNLSELLAKNIYEVLIHPLENYDNHPPTAVSHFYYTHRSTLTVIPKKNSMAEPLDLRLYHVGSQQFPNMHYYFLITPSQTVAAHAHFNILEKVDDLLSIYGAHSVIVLNAIESKMQGDYSLGTVLIQAIFEQSHALGCDGRICLYSARRSGRFYFKLGFMPLIQTIFDSLVSERHHDIDGGLMFLGSDAIKAWGERAKQHPLQNGPV